MASEQLFSVSDSSVTSDTQAPYQYVPATEGAVASTDQLRVADAARGSSVSESTSESVEEIDPSSER